jgi:phosphoserine aminotransferase
MFNALSLFICCRPWGEGADESILQDILAKDKDKKIKAVAVVHNETTTGAHSSKQQLQSVGVVAPMLAWQSCTTSWPQVCRVAVKAGLPWGADGSTAADCKDGGTHASITIVPNETTTGTGWHSRHAEQQQIVLVVGRM